jgi:membrane-bound serine protease (ClpP class)
MDFLGSPFFTNLLYLVLVAGLWLTALAIVSPGTGTLEVLAFAALAAAGFGMAYVEINWWAVVILIVGVVLLLLALRLPHEEVWLLLSAVAFCVGSVFLFRLEEGGTAVHPAVAISASAVTMGYFWIALRNSIIAYKSSPVIDLSKLQGVIGEVRTPLDPTGSIYVSGELWTARADSPLKVGTKVRVRDREGLILIVDPVESS